MRELNKIRANLKMVYHVLCEISEKQIEKNLETYMYFIYFEKTYVNIAKTKIRQTMRRLPIDLKWIDKLNKNKSKCSNNQDIQTSRERKSRKFLNPKD